MQIGGTGQVVASAEQHLARLFESSVRRFADRIAVRYGGIAVSYRELHERANALASVLQEQGVRPRSFVGVSMERGVDLVVAIIGILKAGAAYVPIDPMYPAKRKELILADAGLQLVVSTRRIDLPTTSAVSRLDLDTLSGRAMPYKPDPQLTATDPAYVIYTSGSTGRPKGVEIAHCNAARLFERTHRWFGFDEQDVWTLFHSVGFDFSVWEIWGALLFGGTLVIVPLETARSPAQFSELLAEHKVTILNQTPSAFRNLASAMRTTGRNSHLRHVILGGERLDPQWLRPWFERYGDEQPQLHNMYGTTETTVHATWTRITNADLDRPGTSPIGVPIDDLRIYLLDERLQPVADGAAGELCIEGPGVSRGYLANSELTSLRFVEQVHGGKSQRIYRTGDLASWDAAGRLYYVGRLDDQLKVRGFRIEPREIELCLMQQPGVAAVTVLAQDFGQGDQRLLACVVPAEKDMSRACVDALERSLHELAAAELPSYMRPSEYLYVESLPLTEHGKIDRAALASIAQARDTQPSQPQGESIGDMWERILRRTAIDEHEDFFDLGGTSLALVRLLGEIESRYGTRIDPAALVDGITVARMKALVAQPGMS